MGLKFLDKIRIYLLLVLQVAVFIFWYATVIRNSIPIFNQLSITNNWFFPSFITFVIILNLIFGLVVFGKNIFLRTFFVYLNFFWLALEMVILGYYIIIS